MWKKFLNILDQIQRLEVQASREFRRIMTSDKRTIGVKGKYKEKVHNSNMKIVRGSERIAA